MTYRVTIESEFGPLDPFEFATFDAAAAFVDLCAETMDSYVDHVIETVESRQEETV